MQVLYILFWWNDTHQTIIFNRCLAAKLANMTAEVYHGRIISSSQMWKTKPVFHVLHLALEMKCQLPKPCSFTWVFLKSTTCFWPALLPTLVICQIKWKKKNSVKRVSSTKVTWRDPAARTRHRQNVRYSSSAAKIQALNAALNVTCSVSRKVQDHPNREFQDVQP